MQLIPPMPPYAISMPMEMLIDGAFTNIYAKNVNGEKYISWADATVIFPQDILEEYGVVISSFLHYDNYHINLHQTASFAGFRLAWVETRSTMIIETTPPKILSTEDILFISEPLPERIIAQVTGSSFHENEHFGVDHLAYLTITHLDFHGQIRHGNIIVASSIAEEVLEIFEDIFLGGFPIERIRLIDYYHAQDYYSMADNNSVGFNFRYIAGTTTLSRHALGMAIDINPVQNPYIRGETIWPIAGKAYLDRDNVRPGMIIPGDAAYNAFTSRGWTWGGHWQVPVDYHHFERR